MSGQKKPYKLSGLVRMGAVVPAEGVEPFELPEAEEHPVSETETTTHGRRLQLIDIALIDPNPLAPREVYTPQMILARAEALRTQGQHDPIHVMPHAEMPGRYIICDGWTRVQACRDHQVMHQLLAEIHENMTLEESAWFGYQQNEEREQHCDLDRAMFYEKLIAAGETAAEVARRAGLSKQHMSSFRSFAKLPEDVLDIVRSDPRRFGANAVYQINKVCERVGLKQAVRLASRFAEESRTYSWLLEQVQELCNPKNRKSPVASRQIRFANGFYKQKGDMFEINITVSPEKRAQFAAELESLLATVAQEPPVAEIPESVEQ